MQVEQEMQREIVNRLRRVQGQVNGLIAMIEEGRDCGDVVTQLAAASRALDKVGFKVVASGMRQCQAAVDRGEEPSMSQEQLEKLFLSLS